MSSQDQLSPFPFQRIGDLVAVLNNRVCTAIETGDELEISISHEELISAELRIHQQERLEACCCMKNGAQHE